MDVKLINPFISATLNVLETMAFTHLRQNAPCGSTGMNGVVTRHSFGEGGLLLRRVPPSRDELRMPCAGAQGGFTKAQAGKPYLKKEQVAPGDVSGVIGLTGEVSGTISVSFTEKCILAIVSNTHMTTHPVAIPFSTNNGEFTIEVSFEE